MLRTIFSYNPAILRGGVWFGRVSHAGRIVGVNAGAVAL